jgi:hypothetical protein
MKKTFTAEEVDAIEDKSYETGFDAGFYKMYEITDKVIKTLTNSLEDVWSIEQGEAYPVKVSASAEKMEFAIRTLRYLEDMIEAKGSEARNERQDLL